MKPSMWAAHELLGYAQMSTKSFVHTIAFPTPSRKSVSGGVKSAGVSQSVRETGRDESQSDLSPGKLFKTRDLELPNFEGSAAALRGIHPYLCTPVLPRDQSFGVFFRGGGGVKPNFVDKNALDTQTFLGIPRLQIYELLS